MFQLTFDYGDIMARDYYEVLGVSRGVDEAGLKSAFRKLAMEHHPDRNGGSEEAAGRFKEINEAYRVLSDPKKRAEYDNRGYAGYGGDSSFAADMANGPLPSMDEILKEIRAESIYLMRLFKKAKKAKDMQTACLIADRLAELQSFLNQAQRDIAMQELSEHAEQGVSKFLRQLNGNLPFSERLAFGFAAPLFIGAASVVTKCYAERNEFQNFDIHIAPAFANIGLYASVGVFLGAIIDLYREQRESVTGYNVKQPLLSVKGITSFNSFSKPMTACAVALGLVGTGMAYVMPWYRIEPFKDVAAWNDLGVVVEQFIPRPLSSAAAPPPVIAPQ